MSVLDALAASVPAVRSGLDDWTVVGENPSGQSQIAADRHADAVFRERLADCEAVGTYASEEREEPVDVGSGVAVALDPLDGSSNLATNGLVGTIAGVYEDGLPPGGELATSVALVYGSRTTMTVAADGEVTTCRVRDGERTDERAVSLPETPSAYGFGGRVDEWPAWFAETAPRVAREFGLKARYSGAVVADAVGVLERGGAFAYPASDAHPDGKLRYGYEAAPLSHLVETAGGRGSDGSSPIRDRDAALHEPTPVFLGNAPVVERFEAASPG